MDVLLICLSHLLPPMLCHQDALTPNTTSWWFYTRPPSFRDHSHSVTVVKESYVWLNNTASLLGSILMRIRSTKMIYFVYRIIWQSIIKNQWAKHQPWQRLTKSYRRVFISDDYPTFNIFTKYDKKENSCFFQFVKPSLKLRLALVSDLLQRIF